MNPRGNISIHFPLGIYIIWLILYSVGWNIPVYYGMYLLVYFHKWKQKSKYYPAYSLYIRDSSAITLLSGDHLTMTRLHWRTQEATFIITLMIGEIGALQQPLSINPLSFCNDYVEKIEPPDFLQQLNADQFSTCRKEPMYIHTHLCPIGSIIWHILRRACVSVCLWILYLHVFLAGASKSNRKCLFSPQRDCLSY